MASTYTTNKGIEKPAAGSYNNTWAVPVNADWDAIDNALGGTITISVTGVGAGIHALSLAQYSPPNINFGGTLGANMAYAVPPGVGGTWSVFNNTSGAFTIAFGSSGGSYITLAPNQRTFLISDGVNMQFADSNSLAAAEAYADNAAQTAQNNAGAFTVSQVAASLATAEAFATAADAVVLSTTETFATNAANTAQTGAQTFATAADVVNLAAANTYANGTKNLAAGWAAQPGGQIIQGGIATAISGSPGTTVTFPHAFPTACTSVVAAAYGNNATVMVLSFAAASFQLINGNSTQCTWIAMGY